MRGALLLLILLPSPALAHTGEEFAWLSEPWVLVPLLLSGGLYAAGLTRLWATAGVAHGIRPVQALCFAVGWLTLAAALLSPLHAAGETSFAAHMAEHELLMVVAAPLLVVSRPVGAFLWAFPRAQRPGIVALFRTGPVRAVWRALCNPVVATVVHGAVLWAWHLPAAFDAALESELLHTLQHASFLITALCFWWAMREQGGGLAVLCLFATLVHGTLLGALLTVAPRTLYAYAGPLEDQQLAGLIMWVPAGMVYVGAGLVLCGRWIQRSGRRAGHA
ncbi:MAG TPA: cytochrome c oxidase assembly protein [Azospirillum sp.]|nr:cytochrome c oxidase assembly protein [Azospirillum sp.]